MFCSLPECETKPSDNNKGEYRNEKYRTRAKEIGLLQTIVLLLSCTCIGRTVKNISMNENSNVGETWKNNTQEWHNKYNINQSNQTNKANALEMYVRPTM